MASKFPTNEPFKVRKRHHRRRARRLRGALIAISVVALLWSGWAILDWKLDHDPRATLSSSDIQVTQEPANAFSDARALLTSRGKLPSADLEHALTLLRTTVSKEPDNAAAQAMLAELLVKTGRHSEALKQLHSAVSHSEELRMVLATLCEATNQPLAAREHAQMVIDESRPLAVADLTQVDARLRWAQAELIMGNFEAVETILARGRKAMSDPQYQDVYLQLQLKKSTSTQDSELAMDAIERILAINPGHEQALNQLGRLLSKSKDGSTSRIIDLLANLESASDPALLVYQLLLGYHCHQEEWSRALTISEKGLQRYPQAHSLMNNLAWAMAHQDSPDLPRALELATEAVTSAGEHPIQLEYLATRGTLHRLSSKWTDSIADLEKVLSHLPHRVQLKAQLAESYTQVGQPELAASLLEGSDY